MTTESARRTDHALIEQNAARWLARRDSDRWSSQDEQELTAWMNESMAHSVAYWRLQEAWEIALRLKALGAGVQSEDPPPPGQWNLSPFYSSPQNEHPAPLKDVVRRSFLSSRALVAGMGLLLIAGAAGFLWSSANSFTTPIGAVASLPIEDGSKITLNTDSRIKVALSETERRIELKSGEAFFEVAKDPRRPFIVSVGNKQVIALGTSFSVRKGIDAATDDILVIVTEGAVRIEAASGADNPAGSHLAAGDIASTAGKKILVNHREPHEAREGLSWRNGVLIFKDASLAYAAAEFNRYNKRKIVIEDPIAAALTVAGSFRTTNVDSFVEIIEKGYPVSVHTRRGDFVISAERD